MSEDLLSPHFTRPSTLAALAALRGSDLEAWLKLSARVYTEAEDPIDRIDAFEPLTIPMTENGSRFVANWWHGADAEGALRFSEALASTIETASKSLPTDALILVVEIATHFGIARKLEPIRGYLSRRITAAGGRRQRLGRAIAHLARRSGEAREMRKLAYQMRAAGLLDVISAIELLTFGAAAFGAAIIDDFRTLLPKWFADSRLNYTDEDDAIYAYFANAAVDMLGASDAFEIALYAQARNMPQMRQALEANRLDVETYSIDKWLRGRPIEIIDSVSRKPVNFERGDWGWEVLMTPVRTTLIGERGMLELEKQFEAFSVDRNLKLPPIRKVTA